MSKVGKEIRRDVSLVAERKIRWQDKRHRDVNPVAEREIRWQKEKTPRCQGKKRREILRERKREALGRKVSKAKKRYAIASHVR